MVYYASRNLSMPLRLISSRLSGVSLAKLNEPIKWEANDEIGLLVKEYNQMLHKLEKNKEALARTEKESAWRQMARQVAHENPLTPMKLSLQHLSRTLPSETDEKLKKTIKSLLQQIDTLDDIASSFSEFAKMPIPKREKVELCEVLREAIELHIHNEHVHFGIDIPEHEIYVWTDAKLMGRIFSNIIINAMQSSNEDEQSKIAIAMKTADAEVHISIADNGSGIPEEIKDKVFIPNFSTKYTGSGLGLAIAKRGVEHAGGQISFTDNEPTGTVFHISLPLA